jgi:hypothetical protein
MSANPISLSSNVWRFCKRPAKRRQRQFLVRQRFSGVRNLISMGILTRTVQFTKDQLWSVDCKDLNVKWLLYHSSRINRRQCPC